MTVTLKVTVILLAHLMLDLTQLLRVPHVDYLFDISPDDSKLAFAWNKTGEWQIYEMELDDTSQVNAITTGPGGKFNPRYSPDSSCLAYALDVDGSESYHLVVYDSSTNTHTDLTPGIAYALQPNFCWSPDGSQLGFLSDEQGHFSAYIISVNGGDPQLVLDTSHPAWACHPSAGARCADANVQSSVRLQAFPELKDQRHR